MKAFKYLTYFLLLILVLGTLFYMNERIGIWLSQAGVYVIILLVAYFATEPLEIPIAFVTGTAAILLMAIAGRWWRGGRGAVVSVLSALRHAPWQIVLFSVGMYLVVYGLGNAGLTGYGAQALQWLAQQGNFVATISLFARGNNCITNSFGKKLRLYALFLCHEFDCTDYFATHFSFSSNKKQN